MTKTIIADSSPLIVLLKSNLENILPNLFDEVIVPEAVWQEILSGGKDDAAKLKLPLLTWAKRISEITVNVNKSKIIISEKAKPKR